MNIEKELLSDGIVVKEQLDTDTVLKITNNIAKKIVSTFPGFGLDAEEIFSKLFSLNMYRAQMPEGMAEASYCYKNSSIYFNSHIANEDLEEFAIHECLHFLQEVKDENNKIKKMGLSYFSKFKTVGTGLNEASVQFLSAKIINIPSDFEKYYDVNIFTPSPSYYPVECALLNELVYFVGEDVLFKSTYFSTDDFKWEIIKRTSKKTFYKLQDAFDNILRYEEKIITLNNKILVETNPSKLESEVSKYRNLIKDAFISTQNLIIKEFFDYDFKQIHDLEQLENFRRRLTKFKAIIGSVNHYNFYDNYYIETMNKLEHKSNILENGGIETALANSAISKFVKLLNKIRGLFLSMHE